jgi:hypothetical protein
MDFDPALPGRPAVCDWNCADCAAVGGGIHARNVRWQLLVLVDADQRHGDDFFDRLHHDAAVCESAFSAVGASVELAGADFFHDPARGEGGGGDAEGSAVSTGPEAASGTIA